APQDAVDEELELLLEHVARIVEPARVRELAAVRHDLVELRDVEPLEREILDERHRAVVREHPADLPREDLGVAELRRVRELEQLLVRQAAPEEERQARREL